MKLEKLQVRKSFYLTFQLIYVLICLIGLLIQIVEISLNYFQYQVVSNVEVIIPGREERKALNLCFQTWQFMDETKYQNIISELARNDQTLNEDISTGNRKLIVQKYFTISDRFEATFDVGVLDFFYAEDFTRKNVLKYTISKSIIENYICYYLAPEKSSFVEIPYDYFKRKFDSEYF